MGGNLFALVLRNYSGGVDMYCQIIFYAKIIVSILTLLFGLLFFIDYFKEQNKMKPTNKQLNDWKKKNLI